eukprot:1228328-Amorphochlora_amoeboformis.AAC.2
MDDSWEIRGLLLKTNNHKHPLTTYPSELLPSEEIFKNIIHLQALINENERLVVIRWGRDEDPLCEAVDQIM